MQAINNVPIAYEQTVGKEFQDYVEREKYFLRDRIDREHLQFRETAIGALRNLYQKNSANLDKYKERIMQLEYSVNVKDIEGSTVPKYEIKPLAPPAKLFLISDVEPLSISPNSSLTAQAMQGIAEYLFLMVELLRVIK